MSTRRGVLVPTLALAVAVAGVVPAAAQVEVDARTEVRSIDFAGKQLRTDIGWRELTRGVRS